MLLASAAMGALYLVLLFLLCFGGVVGFRLWALHSRALRDEALREEWEREHEQAQQPQQAQPQQPPQQVDYIVEKKRTRAKQEYAAPREIRFQK